ncbi:hypothetical protein P3T76_004820 [Phytophthora citrophthora]|uniref:Uncharacterized protein n=1 Tax=Phytophthora citrophthora TaxID=4793 RepID=A0AAD9GQX7_9STRA|nr:hypothetical protein P3T76_004820 [Phytophthora citrophthora]
MQVTHYGGKYSIERMLALKEYTRTTSLGRVLLVLFISPLPVVVLLLSQESIPLQDPRDGWRANYGFWIRFAILQGVLGYSAVNVITYLLDGAAFSLRQMIQCSIYVGSSYTVAVMVISAHWAFPIPFVNVSVGLIWIIFFVLTLRIVAGSSAFWRMMSQREQLLRLNKFCTIQILMTTFYPAYQVLFNTAKHTRYELPVILILPIVKLIMKSVLASTIVHKEDTVPEQVILTIDFFDALYLATFMQSLSNTTVVVIMAIDLAQSAVDLRELHQRTKSILNRLHNSGNPDNRFDILSAIRSLCCHPELIREQVNRNIQVHSYRS